MKAAAPLALLSPQAKAGGPRPGAAKAAHGAGTGTDAFLRILTARLGLKDGRPARAQKPAPAQAGQAAAAPQAAGHGGGAGEALQAGAKEPAGRTAKRPARARGASLEMAGLDAGLAQAGLEPGAGKPARRVSPQAAEAEPAAAVSRRQAGPRLVVLDLRSRAEAGAPDAKGLPAAVQTASAGRDGDGQAAAASFAAKPAGAREAAPRGARPAGAAAGPFETALERLRGMAGSEMVRASGIILRDGGGEIRLVLRPESLGSVRIRMNLVDNGIEGRIIVDNAAVKQVLDSSLDALARALTAQGFQTASLEVAVGGQNADGGRAAGEPHPATRQQVAEGFERNVPGIESMSLGDLLVNLFA